MRICLTICLLLLACVLIESDAERKGRDNKGGKKLKHKKHRLSGRDGLQADQAPGHEIHVKKIDWLNVHEVVGCQCKHGEICIEGPNNGQPICVKRHDLQESARLFHHFNKQKEAALEEGSLNEVSPHTFEVLESPHDLHINVLTKHRQSHKSLSKFKDARAKITDQNLILNKTPFPEELPSSSGTSMKSENPIIPNSNVECTSAVLNQMRQRLTGWFHILHKKTSTPHHGHDHHEKKQHHLSVKKELRDGKASDKHCNCLRSVMWEFRKLDDDNNHILNSTELQVIDNNEMEPCLHPYLSSCDTDTDGSLSHHEWCCCFLEVDFESPCYARLHEIEQSSHLKVDYIPRCDKEGYFEKEQCSGMHQESKTCWCVTPNGTEIPESRTKGHGHCA